VTAAALKALRRENERVMELLRKGNETSARFQQWRIAHCTSTGSYSIFWITRTDDAILGALPQFVKGTGEINRHLRHGS
jgi:hypothetical protein